MDTRRDFVYVQDLVDVLEKAVDGAGRSGPYHISSGLDYSIKELFDATVDALTRSIATGPAIALRNVKRLLRESLDRPLSRQLRAEADSFGQCAADDDFAEGIEAFFAKRPPRFR